MIYSVVTLAAQVDWNDTPDPSIGIFLLIGIFIFLASH